MRKKALGFYDYTVVLTYCGMLFAFFGILRGLGQNYRDAIFCLMMAGICDMFDGTVASTKMRTVDEKKFGIQIDSLSDLVSFGVLPGIFIYMISNKNVFAGLAASFYVLSALIRLAYFNVLEEKRQNGTCEMRKSYLGLPVTTAALFLPIIYLLYDYRIIKNTVCFCILLGLMGMGFITPVEVKKPQFKGKVCLIILGILEAVGVLFMMGWDAV